MTSEKLEQLRTDILKTCLLPHDGKLASGIEADSILDMRRLESCNEMAARAIASMVPTARNFRPDLVVPIPNGANWIGRELGLSLGTGSVLLDKDPETGEITMNPIAERVINRHKRILLAEDVFTEGTNTRKVLGIPAIAERAVAVCAIWDRGDPAERPPLDIPLWALFPDRIPPKLPKNSEFWRYLKIRAA